MIFKNQRDGRGVENIVIQGTHNIIQMGILICVLIHFIFESFKEGCPSTEVVLLYTSMYKVVQSYIDISIYI